MAPLAGAMMLTLLLLCWCCFLERHCNTIRGANSGVETAAGVELSGAVYRLSDGAGVKTRAVGTGDCGGGLCAAGTSRGVECGLDAAAGVYGDVYRRPFTNPTASFAGVLSNVSHLSEPGLWLTAIGLSQVISNVPSTILLLNYVPPSLLLAWAVNVGALVYYPDRWQI